MLSRPSLQQFFPVLYFPLTYDSIFFSSLPFTLYPSLTILLPSSPPLLLSSLVNQLYFLPSHSTFQEIPLGEESKRLAIVNLDWDHVHSSDLFKVFDAFCPPDGLIHSVRIFPSDFGKQRLLEEENSGPPSLIFKSILPTSTNMSSTSRTARGRSGKKKSEAQELIYEQVMEEGGEDGFNARRLRRYQLERLKYYFAVVETDSIATAKAIYNSCDRAEFEKSANFLDLRFIPDDMEFDDEPKYEKPLLPFSDSFTP